jgi:hypothetical protein
MAAIMMTPPIAVDAFRKLPPKQQAWQTKMRSLNTGPTVGFGRLVIGRPQWNLLSQSRPRRQQPALSSRTARWI